MQQLFVGPPGTQRITASAVDFKLEAGEALGVIGPSAAGKTSLARALLGLWQPARGAIWLDGATLDQWEPEDRGSFLGYLPQTVELLEGTVAEIRAHGGLTKVTLRAEELPSLDGAASVDSRGDRHVVLVEDADAFVAALVRSGTAFRELTVSPVSLEDAVVALEDGAE